MTKIDIVSKLSQKKDFKTLTKNLTRAQASEIVDVVADIIIEGLNEEGQVQFSGFGTLKCKDVPARIGHNPKDPSVKINIPARRQVTFSAGSILKEAINGSEKRMSK